MTAALFYTKSLLGYGFPIRCTERRPHLCTGKFLRVIGSWWSGAWQGHVGERRVEVSRNVFQTSWKTCGEFFHRRSRPLCTCSRVRGMRVEVAARVPRRCRLTAPRPVPTYRTRGWPFRQGHAGKQGPRRAAVFAQGSSIRGLMVRFGSEANLSPPQGVEQRLPSSLGGGGAGQLSLSPLCDLRSRVG